MKVIQYVTSDTVTPLIKKCLDSVVSVYPQVEVFYADCSDVAIKESDYWRWKQMLAYDDILYIDWDVEIYEPFVFQNNGYATMVFYKGQPDNCIMYSPNRKIFEQWEIERIRRGIVFDTMGWFRKVLRDKSVNELNGMFVHHRVSGITKLRENYN